MIFNCKQLLTDRCTYSIPHGLSYPDDVLISIKLLDWKDEIRKISVVICFFKGLF